MQDKETPSDPDLPFEATAENLTAHYRALARECGAETFELYRIRGRDHALIPVLASDDRLLKADSPTASLPKDLAKLAAASICILWWGSRESALGKVLSGCEWAVRIRSKSAEPGLGMPLAASEGAQGIAVFQGGRLCTDTDRLIALHARCHALFDKLPDAMPERGESNQPAISRRELQCLKLTANGLTSEEIAIELGLSVHTANQYLSNATQKLDATNRIHAVANALREGLID